MKKTVLVIDPNPTVQAIAALALSQLELTVKSVSDGSTALEMIGLLKPDLILCAREATGLDPFALCRKLKADPKSSPVFVLLMPADVPPNLKREAGEAGVDELLSKPFKSEQLRAVAKRLLTKPAKKRADAAPQRVALIGKDPVLLRIAERTLIKLGFSVRTGTAAGESYHGEFANVAATVVFEDSVADYTWYNPNQGGKLLVVANSVKSSAPVKGAQLLNRPLSVQKVATALGVTPAADEGTDGSPLEPAEQLELAARISSAVFERLLGQPALAERNWEEVVTAVRNEALRVCQEFSS